MRNSRISQVPEDVTQLRTRAEQRRCEPGLSAADVDTLDGILETDWLQASPSEVAWLRARRQDVLA